MTTGLNTFLSLSLLLRLAGVACGCFYGPYLYLVVSIGGLYLLGNSLLVNIENGCGLIFTFTGDFLLLWSLNRRTSEGKFLCDFTSQKVWIILWQIMNIIGIIGLIVAMCKFRRA